MTFILRIERWFNTHKSVNTIPHSNKIMNTSHVIISAAAEETFDKIQQPFIRNDLNKLGIERTHPNIVKVYSQPTSY